jgi:hypothetical protein
MGLFGNSSMSASPAPPPSYATPPNPSAFNMSPSQSPPVPSPAPTMAMAQPAQPPAPRLQSYIAYDKNDLKVTLTPQTSPAKPGLVMILARFQVSGDIPAVGLTFQAAVPKVGFFRRMSAISRLIHSAVDPAAEYAADVQPRHKSRVYRNTADARHCSSRGESLHQTFVPPL